MTNNVPYQRYIDGGYFKIREKTTETAYGTKVFTTTYVTGKGQIYITEKLRTEYEKKIG
jgi:anti-repressor protein